MAEAWRVHRVKAAVAIFDVLQRLGVHVEFKGTHQICCPNPQHDDRRPSARVYADDNRVHCFRCAKSWDVLDLVQLIAGLSGLDEAVQWCEHQFNLPDASEAAPEIVLGVMKAAPKQDLSRAAGDVESAIRYHHLHVIPFLLSVYTNIWTAFDIAKAQHASGQMTDEDYLDFLTNLKKRALECHV